MTRLFVTGLLATGLLATGLLPTAHVGRAGSSAWFTGVMPWEPLPGSGGDPVGVDTGLARVLRSLGAPAPATLGSLFEDWDAMVGDQMAAHVRPIRLRDTTLVVAVNEPGWASQVRWMAPELLERLAAGLGDGVVTDVEVRVEAPGGGAPRR